MERECKRIELGNSSPTNYLMTKTQLTKFLTKAGYESVKKIVPSMGFTPDNADPTCLVTPIIDTFKTQLLGSGIKFSLEDSVVIENTNPNDFAVDFERKRIRYAFKVPYKTPNDNIKNLMITFNITTYWYDTIEHGRNEITVTIDVMAEETWNKT